MPAVASPDSVWIETILEAGSPDAVCLQLQRRLSYQEMRSDVHRWADRLWNEGIRPGSTVSLQVPPSFSYIQVLLALWLHRAQVCLFDYRLKPSEVTGYEQLCQPEYVIRARDVKPGVTSFVEQRELVVTVHPDGRPARTAHSLVQFTSGSTGRPKIIGRTGASILAELERWSAFEGTVQATDRLLVLSSLTHTLGLMAGLLLSFRAGATVVLPTRIAASELLKTLATVPISFLMGGPFHYELLATVRDAVALPHLRCAISGGEKLRAEVHAQFERKYGIAIGEAYGMSEVGIIAADLTGRQFPASGPVAAGLPLELRDGEVSVYLGESPYLQVDDPTSFQDGWLRTRDRGILDDATGALTILGRSDSLAIVGGLKVDLAEIEAILTERGDIDEVVVLYGDGIEAYIGAKAGLDPSELLRWCAERMAHYKIPRRLYVAPALPRTVTGKAIRTRGDLLAAVGERRDTAAPPAASQTTPAISGKP
jgi:acyl-CoA synthetase (AMP-forming)/AMP-acid ligase II